MPNKPQHPKPHPDQERQEDGTGAAPGSYLGEHAWNILCKLGAQPDALAAVCPQVSELEAHAALKLAEARIREAERKKRERLRRAVPVRETPDEAALADALRSSWTVPTGA